MILRAADPTDFPAVLALNKESETFLSPLSIAQLVALHEKAALHLVSEQAGQVTAFLLALREHVVYDSVNYQWFENRFPSFLYIDRVVVGRSVQAKGTGALMYRQVFAHAEQDQVPLITCEYDIDPPNPASAHFHTKFGFHEVGRQSTGNGKKQVSLQVAETRYAIL